jgi:hypothetical protein
MIWSSSSGRRRSITWWRCCRGGFNMTPHFTGVSVVGVALHTADRIINSRVTRVQTRLVMSFVEILPTSASGGLTTTTFQPM